MIWSFSLRRVCCLVIAKHLGLHATMFIQTFFITFFVCISFGSCQFVRTYPRSVFENVGLGEAPQGVYIPQDSFLNALRNPSYRTPISPAYSVPQQTYSAQPAAPIVQQNTHSTNVMVPEMEQNDEERRPRRRTIHKRRRIFNEQIGTPRIYSPSQFESIPLGGVPTGVYVPPDSLLNALRSSGSRDAYPVPQIATNANTNFGLERAQLPVIDHSQEMAPVRQPESPSVQYVAPSSELDDGDYGRRRTSSERKRSSTVGRRMPPIRRPPSLVLDPSMEYPADKPREQMQSLPRTVEEYYDLDSNMQHSSVTRQPKRRPSQRRRTQNKVKPNYEEPVYPDKTYSPSVFQNIGLGEAPNGVRIPEDSLLNVLKGHNPRRQTPRTRELPQTQRTRELPQTQRPRELPQESYDTMPFADTMEAREANLEEVPPQEIVQSRRNVSRRRSRLDHSSEMTENRENSSRRRQQEEPVLTFRESSRQRSDRRNSASNRRRSQSEE